MQNRRARYTRAVEILYVASEVTPFSKTGGLADVAGALPAALARLGARVSVVSPWYATLDARPEPVASVAVPGAAETVRAGRITRDGVTYLFLGSSHFDRERPYGYPDDVERFTRFCVAVPHAAAALGLRPDVVHLNDWQAGLIAPALRFTRVPPSQARARTVFTVHNLQYQGRWNPREVLEWAGLPWSLFQPNGLEFFGDVNCLKAGLVYADAITTVSPTYAREVQTPALGEGLDGVLRRRGVTGILNGLDTAYWDPARDAHLRTPYADFAGKRAATAALRAELGFDGGRPVLSMVTRLADQKGLDLVMAALPAILEDWDLVVLGAGEARYAGPLEAVARFAPGRVAFRAGFDEPLAHRIYAGADAILMPSRFEPCGLAQMIAMRYGTLPVVRRTGGLADTVPDSRGFGFDAYEPAAMTAALRRAREAWGGDAWRARALEGMAADFGWENAAHAHLELYRRVTA